MIHTHFYQNFMFLDNFFSISRKRNSYILLLIFCFCLFILGFSWKVGYCPICNQPLGWIWRKSDNGNDTGSLGHTGVKFNRTDSLGHTGVQQFYGIRLDKVTDWTNFVFGPLIEVPRLLASFGWKLSAFLFVCLFVCVFTCLFLGL